ncbi:MAG TPA: L-seryl-tRNA(Sec) selenium transferase [Candidatus Baltobacteraceae bacterium]|jgi:L-seryl-tRNA(Ser) seleniumtransferase
MADARREIPPVNAILEHPSIAPYEHLVGRETLRRTIAGALDRIRAEGTTPPTELLVAEIAESVERDAATRLLPVVNATGVLLHTNLGRAPLAEQALAVAREIGAGYSDLEYDLIGGRRGSRYAHASALLTELTGAEDALVVNNNAAAVLLIVDTFARDREVIVARGQAIEIGGGFRLPDVLSRSGATLVDVGTSNKTYLRDYERALTPRTGLLLRAHPSNFSVEGFVRETGGAELAALGKRVGVPVVEDLGSGALLDLCDYGLPHERTVQEALRDGIDLVAFSGDKLLGGPQAGIVVGSAALIARLRANPLLRALRTDKTTLALLGGTLRLHRTRESRERIPFYAMLASTMDDLRARAARYVARIDGAHVEESLAYVGGGSLPQATVRSLAIAFPTPYADALAERLRRGEPPIVTRISEGTVLLDLRTIAPGQDAAVINALRALAD